MRTGLAVRKPSQSRVISMVESHDRSFELERFRRLGVRADAWALASEATIAKDLYATVASGGTKSFGDLIQDVAARDLSQWDTFWIARVARILALQPHAVELHEFAFEALKLVVPRLSTNSSSLHLRKILYELLFERGELDEAEGMLRVDPALDNLYHGYLGADLLNPFSNGSIVAFDSWLEQFNRPFIAAGLSPVTVCSEGQIPFDGLAGTVAASQETGPLVSVIVTTFNPRPVEIRTSVRSILSQTWRNLEILLIDDCSSESSDDVLEELASEDSRIRLIRLPVNGGTYRARNVGITSALGKYVTGQDTDDWSHPERIARQVKCMESYPDLPGVTITANRTDYRLIRVALGHNPERRCEVSLMVRLETAKAVGGYLPVRKAADSEFRERIEAWSGAIVRQLDEPLYMIRMSSGSLSRADFRPGWSHHARRGFWSAYKQWHRNTARNQLTVNAENLPISISSIAPARIVGHEWSAKDHFDVCVVSDWRGKTAEQRSAFDELLALAASGHSVAILHLDTPWGGAHDPRALVPEVQQLINEGVVDRIFLDQNVWVDLVLVRDPATMDYGRRVESTVIASQVLMVAHSVPALVARHRRPYDPYNAHEMAQSIFGLVPYWVVPEAAGSLRLREEWDLPFIDERYPVYIDAGRFSGIRMSRPPGRPVVGRTAENEIDDWPVRKLLPEIYPTNGDIDFRVFGDARGAARVLGIKHLPVDWVQYKTSDLPVEVFWRTLDAKVLYDQKEADAGLERSVLEALSSGVPVITDSRRARIYGDAVVQATPNEVPEILNTLLSDARELDKLRGNSKRLVDNYADPKRFCKYIDRRVTEARPGVERHA